VLNRKNRTLVRRLQTEKDEPFNFTPRVQGGGGSVRVWGCMAAGARAPLVFYSGRVNGAAYINIIKDELSMFIDNAFDRHTNEVWFMHDNPPAHRSGFTNKWFEDNKIIFAKMAT
jgi:hypothetical protein